MKKVAALVIIVIVVLFFMMRSEGDNEFFTSYFNEMVEAGESKNLEQFMNFFSLQYKDENGVNYILIKNITRKVFNEYDTIQGSFTDLSSKMEKIDGKEVAVINLDVSAVGLKNGIDAEILGHDASAENITVYLEKSTLGKWKIVEVEGIDKNFDY